MHCLIITHYETDVSPAQLIMPPKLKHKSDRYVRYVNFVNVVIFLKNTNDIVEKSTQTRNVKMQV